MESEVSVALREFTQRYVDLWQQETGMPPSSEALFGVESPCVVKTDEDKVFWLTQIFSPESTLAVAPGSSSVLHHAICRRHDRRMAGQCIDAAAGLEPGRFHPLAGKPDWSSGDTKTSEADADGLSGDDRFRVGFGFLV